MGAPHTTDNDTEPDDTNHAPYGLMIFHDPQQPKGGQVLAVAQLYDILPTLLGRYDISRRQGCGARCCRFRTYWIGRCCTK